MRDDLITKLEKVNKAIEAYSGKWGPLSKKKWEILDEINQKSPIRITEVTKDVLLLREKALKNKEVKSVMEKYGFKIDEIALVKDHGEKLRCPGGYMFNDGWSDYWMNPKRIKEPGENGWELWKSYFYGGRGDAFQVLFRYSNNSKWYVSGIMLNFPREKKAA
jgi:hypothetical protein